MAGRVTLQPVPLNISPGSPGLFIPAGSIGYDTGSPGGSFTAWGSNNGVQFVNNGQMFLAFVNGTGAVTYDILIGQKAAGVVPLFSTVTGSIAASSGPGWLPPLSPQGYNQQDSSVHAGSPAGAVGIAGIGMTCIDFSSVTNLGVRLYQLIPVTP